MSGSTKPRSVHSSTSGRIVTENPALLQLLRERTGDSSIGTATRPAAGGTSPDHGVAAGGHNPATTQRSEGQGQPTTRQSDIVKDSLEASHDLQDSLDLEQSHQLKDSLDSDSGKNSPITGRKTYPVESPTSNKIPNINTASAHTRRKDNPNALSQVRPDSELSRGIPTPKPSSGVPDSAKSRVPQPTARSEEPATRRSTSSVYAVANPAVLAAQGDTPREGTQNAKFTPRAEQAVQRRENTQGSAKPHSIIKRESTQGSVKPQSVTKREDTRDSVKPAKLTGRQDTQDSDRAPPSGRNSSKPQVGDSVNNNAKVNSATSGRKSGRSAVSFHPEPKNRSDNSDSDEEQIRAPSSHLKERVPTPHPRSPLKPDQVTPRRDTTPQIKEWDSDGQSDTDTPKPAPAVPQPQGHSPSPVVQERRSANTTLPTVKRVYVDSPTFTPEEEDQYRFVESRLDEGQDDIEDTFRKLDKGDKVEPMATTTQAPPIQGGHPSYTRDNYDGGVYNSQYSRPPPEPQYREDYRHNVRKEIGGQGAPQGGQYIRKDSEGPGAPIPDQYSRNNNQGERPHGYDSQYSQQAQNRGYSQDVRGGGDNQGDPRVQPPAARDTRQDNRYEDRNRVMSQNKGQGQNDRYEDKNAGYGRYEDRNEQPQYDDRNRHDRYEDRNQYNSYNRGDRGQEDRNDPPQYQDGRQGPAHLETNDRNRYDDRPTYNDQQNRGRNEAEQYDDHNDNYRQPRSLIQNGYEPEEDEQQLIKQEEEYQAHLQSRLRDQAQQDEEFVIPKLPLEDSLEDPWQNPPPPPPQQAYQEPSGPYGYDERETERMEIVNPPPVKYDFVENNKVDYGKVPDKSYAYLLERKKEGENKLDSVFITPKLRSKKTTRNNVTSNKSRGDSPPDDYIPSENASMAEALWAKRSTALEKKKDAKQTNKSKTASGTSLRKNRGLQKYSSENGLVRQPLYSQGQSQGRQPVHMYGTPTRNHYLEPLENKANRPKPSDRMDGQGMPPASFKPIDLKPVTQEIVTEDGQRISVDINLKVLSPRGEGGDPRGIPQVSAEVLHGSQATGGVRPVGTQYYPGAYEGQDLAQDPYRQQYYQSPPGPPPGLPPGLSPAEPYNFDYSQAQDQENQLPPQRNQDYEPQYQPQGSPPYQSQPHQTQAPYQTQRPYQTQQSQPHQTQRPYQTQQSQPPEVPAPQTQSPQYQRHPSYEQQSHPVYDQQQQGYSQQPSYEAEPKHQSPNPYPKIPPISAGTEDRFATGPIRVELEGYSAIHQKNRQKDPNEQPWYQVYTLSDYKKLKKEMDAGRGPLGPDMENETFKEKLEKKHKQNEYARLVMERNRQELLDRKPVQRRQPSHDQREENKRRAALDYAKNVPKPVVKAKPSQYNSYEVSSQLSPLNKKGNQSPVKTQPPIEVVDLNKLQQRHEEEKQNVAMIKQNIPQKV
ncbi:serine/arginine repetitive matrix protein 2-like isoform X2 [Mizuhopecten yessoensis]|uniref:serine/arginine repetitive matrix protein 2-like isoform X2 n=1 Tax=Mizuhopecten yessoensis TaxID=6573 RepID=UPI000B45C5FA|nr:serine/arginine repetitive matrix protein 2-like isoform X2 [Mizuhopecten yessoensis]